MAEPWPATLIPTDVAFQLKAMNAGGPATQSGRRQVVATDAGFWVATMSGFFLHTADQVREWRGLITGLSGMAGSIVIGPFDCRHPPWSIVNGKPVHRIGGVTHSDSTKFSDTSAYSQTTIDITLTADIALRATSLTATLNQAGTIKRGMYFSIDDRLYMITGFPAVSGSDVTFSFLPPARAPAIAGTVLNFSNPRAVMRLSSPDSGQLEINMGRFAHPALDLEESFDGL